MVHKQLLLATKLFLSPGARQSNPAPARLAEERGFVETITALIVVATKIGWDMIMNKQNKPAGVKPTDVKGCEGKFCIKKGDPKSELIREINIRLTGFGGSCGNLFDLVCERK